MIFQKFFPSLENFVVLLLLVFLFNYTYPFLNFDFILKQINFLVSVFVLFQESFIRLVKDSFMEQFPSFQIIQEKKYSVATFLSRCDIGTLSSYFDDQGLSFEIVLIHHPYCAMDFSNLLNYIHKNVLIDASVWINFKQALLQAIQAKDLEFLRKMNPIN